MQLGKGDWETVQVRELCVSECVLGVLGVCARAADATVVVVYT
jgi:hypothetical protein